MKTGKSLFLKFVTDTSVGGTWFPAGAVKAFEPVTYRRLLREQVAVPAASPLAAALATDKIRPFYEDQTQ